MQLPALRFVKSPVSLPRTLWLAAVVCVCSVTYQAAAQRSSVSSKNVSGADKSVALQASPSDASQAAPSDKPEVIPPQLQHFVEATYPQEALKQGIQADVILRLSIDAKGEVTEAVVDQPAGHDFDEAAQKAAMQFRFTPAMRNGSPMASRILYRYRFTFEEKPVEPAVEDKEAPTGSAPLSNAAVVRNLAGHVLSIDGDAPISGAVITVAKTGGDGAESAQSAEQTATTDEQGGWHFSNLSPGRYRVTVQAPGFEPLEVHEEIAEKQLTELVYRLTMQGVVHVIIRGERPSREVTKRTIERSEIERIPGTSGDALRSLQNLPGVARPPSVVGMLIVRGSSPQDTRVYIDGVFSPLVYHFGGLSSVVPAELLERIDFYPGNFSSQFGRAMGGIVDVGIRAPKDDGKYHGMAQFDLIDVRGIVEGPVPFAKKWHFALGARRSWFDTWLKPVMTAAGASVAAAPVYYDYQIIAQTKPTARSSLRLGFIGADDRMALLTKDVAGADATVSGNLNMVTAFWRLFARYEQEITNTTRLSAVVALGRDGLDFDIGTLFFRQLSYPITNRVELSQRFGSRVTMHLGMDMYGGSMNVKVLAPQPPTPGEPPSGPFVSKPPLELRRSGGVFRPGFYTEWELTPWDRLKIVPGIRFDYSRDIERWDIAPRLNARYLIAQEFPKTAIKAGAGVYHRPPGFNESQPPFGSEGLRSNRSIHYAIGFEQDITQQVDLSVEGYYKDMNRLVGAVGNEAGSFSYNNLATGYAVGGELLLRYRPDDKFFGWLAYTLSRSMVREQPGRDELPAAFDQTHILTALGSYQLGRGWQVGARFRLVSGRPLTPVVGSIYDANAGSYVSITGKPSSERAGLFRQLDLRADKTWTFSGWKLSMYLDVQNVTYAKNMEGYRYNYDYTDREIVEGLPIIPSLGVRGEF